MFLWFTGIVQGLVRVLFIFFIFAAIFNPKATAEIFNAYPNWVILGIVTTASFWNYFLETQLRQVRETLQKVCQTLEEMKD